MIRPLAAGVLLSALLALAAAGCGEAGGGPGDADTTGGDGGNLVVAALGDSITSGSPGYDPDPQAQAGLGFGSDPESQYGYWAERAHPGLVITNCGIFGQRTDEIAARLNDCAEGADAIVIQGGINDIAQGLPVEGAAENLRGMVVAAKRMGLKVAIVDVLPWNNGHPQADPLIEDLNSRIAQIAEDEQVQLLPFHDTLEDPDNPGTMRPDWTADGDHPSVAGYRRLGEIAFAIPGS